MTVANFDVIPEVLREIVLQRPLRADDLRAFPDDRNRYEIIGRQLFVSPSPTFRHQFISMKLGHALDTFLTERDLGVVVAAPMVVHLSENDVV